MSKIYWQAKLWGLLHDPVFKPLHRPTDKGGNSCWRSLAAMQDWPEDWDPEAKNSRLYRLKYADYITSASDRGAIGSLTEKIDYQAQGLQVSHLLSGAKLWLKLREDPHERLMQTRRGEFLQGLEESLFEPIQNELDPRKTFWWCWRCLPERAVNALGNDESLLLAPAETRLPDSSIWSHNSLTAALAGSFAGYATDRTYFEKQKGLVEHPQLAIFSFSPIQELIKASRKMRDFWAGSWLLHYLSAKICWALAWKYGPDSLLYPSLFQQPLIDHLLIQQYPEFKTWIQQPNARQLLTSGFPNVLVLVLPKSKVAAAMQQAGQTLREEWLRLGQSCLTELVESRHWPKQLFSSSHMWNGWLNSQWQTYWTAVPIGMEAPNLKPEERFKKSIGQLQKTSKDDWVTAQNRSYFSNYNPEKPPLFKQAEFDFLKAAGVYRDARWGRGFSVNVGSWWPYIFDRTRKALQGVKNARTWELPTVFSVRSSISGLGPAVYPFTEVGQIDWAFEEDVRDFWQDSKYRAGLFDGSEMLNSGEILKRVLPKVLSKELGLADSSLCFAYPDLTAGVAGYLRTHSQREQKRYCQVIREVQNILQKYKLDSSEVEKQGWGIPWADQVIEEGTRLTPPRFLNPGWLLEDLGIENEEQASLIEEEIQRIIVRVYGDRNPTSWYVLATGDGDDMGEWLRGSKLESYGEYVPDSLGTVEGLDEPSPDWKEKTRQAAEKVREVYPQFLNEKKRMGPSTHSALSRALLDFSNKLVPYLTEGRYAGRLIYSGGDDVLAYTNLWEWDQWLWDIRQCFQGKPDPAENGEFSSKGDYWTPRQFSEPSAISERLAAYGIGQRPLFTLGSKATISFGIVIANQAVPLAIALENLWEAEKEAKAHKYPNPKPGKPEEFKKDAVQVRILYANGNCLKATAKFDAYKYWRELLDYCQPFGENSNRERLPAFFEQAAEIWKQHPAPTQEAIAYWATAFCSRRDLLESEEEKKTTREVLTAFLSHLWETTAPDQRDEEIRKWLKLTAFLLRQRHIPLKRGEE